MFEVNNVTPEGLRHVYIVARFIDGELWFWGGYNTLERASEVALMVDGVWLEAENVVAI